jgi:hypothetical protein
MHARPREDQPVRLVEHSWQKGDPDPKAMACYGVLWQEGTPTDPARDEMWLRFVTGRPVSDITTQFLDWCCAQLQAQGKSAWLLIWDNASWHKSLIVRTWIRQHNHQVKQEGQGVRILPFCSQRKVLGSIPSSPSGYMASVLVLNPMNCFRLANLPSGSVPTFTVRTKLILLFPRKCLEYAPWRGATVSFLGPSWCAVRDGSSVRPTA